MITNRMGTVFNNGESPFQTASLAQQLVENSAHLRTSILNKFLESRRDYNKECGYDETVQLTILQYKEMFDRNPIAARVVDVFPEESWQSPPEIYEDEDINKSTAFEKDWEEVGRLLLGSQSWFKPTQHTNPIWPYLKRLDIQSGIGHYGLLLIGIDDGKRLDEPVTGFEDPEEGKPGSPVYVSNLSKKKHRLLYLSVFNEAVVQTIEYDTNRYSPRFNRPRFYTLNLIDADSNSLAIDSRQDGTIRVHWSRILHVADNLESSEIIATPRQRPVWNRLVDLNKLYGSSAEGFWQSGFPGLALETHPQLGGDVYINKTDLRSQLWDYFNGLQRALALTGMSAKSLSPQVSDPSGQIRTQLEAICIKLGIPMRIFMGSERGELASGQDDSTWNDRLRERKTKYLTPRVVVPFIDRLILMGVLSVPKEYSVVWPDPESLKPQEKAAIAVQRVDAISKYIAGQCDTLIDPMNFFTRILEIDKVEAEEILADAAEFAEEQAAEEEKLQKEQAEKAAAVAPPPNEEQAAETDPNNPEQPVGQLGGRADFSNVSLNAGFASDAQRKAVFAKLGKGMVRRRGLSPGASAPSPSSGEQPRGPGGQFGETADKDPTQKDLPAQPPQKGSSQKLTTDLPETDTSGIPKGKKMDAKTRAVIEEFEGGGYYDINAAFRGGLGNAPSKDQKEAIRFRKAFNEFSVETTKDMVVYRGLDKDAIDAAPGASFHDKAFPSVSTNARYAAGFSTEGQMLAITVPKGTRVLQLPNSAEGEIILDQGQYFKLGDPVGVVKRGDAEIKVYGTRMGYMPITNEDPIDNVFCATGKGGGVDPTCGKITVKGQTLSFATRDPDTKKWMMGNGKPAPDHIQKLGIPPAWSNVHVNTDSKGTILARGLDSKGRVQMKYSESHSATQAAVKFKRVTELRKKREGIFKEIEKDRKNPELREQADCLRLVMQTGIRPGSTKDTGADYKSFGATTLEGRHVKVKGNKVFLEFVSGKNKGRPITIPVRDEATANMLRQRAAAAGKNGRLFNTDANKLRDYSKTKDGGGFKTKDHRTALGTETALAAIKQSTPPTNKKEYKAMVKAVATEVSQTLGNTPSVALKSYIDPIVFAQWRQKAGV